jgi:hypothetical protein
VQLAAQGSGIGRRYGGTGQYGAPISLARRLAWNRVGMASSPPMKANGTIGEPVCRAMRMKPVPNCVRW